MCNHSLDSGVGVKLKQTIYSNSTLIPWSSTVGSASVHCHSIKL